MHSSSGQYLIMVGLHCIFASPLDNNYLILDNKLLVIGQPVQLLTVGICFGLAFSEILACVLPGLWVWIAVLIEMLTLRAGAILSCGRAAVAIEQIASV